jgi:GAF domain-containing protein
MLWLVNADFLRPLRTLGAALKMVQEGIFDRRLSGQVPRDLTSLVERYHAMTAALQNWRQALDDQLRRTSLLTQLSIELREALDPTTITERLLRVVTPNLRVTSARVILVGPDGGLELGYSMQDNQIQAIAEPQVQTILDHGWAGWALRSGRSFVSSDITRDKRWSKTTQDAFHTGSVIIVPIRQERTAIGALIVHHRTPNYFTSHDLVLMEGVAAQVSVSLNAARCYLDECQRREQALALLAMSQFLTAERSYGELTAMLHEYSRTIFHADSGLLFLANSDATPELTAIVSPQDLAANSELGACAASIAKQAWSAAKIVTDSITCAGETHRLVALPLVHNGAAIGVFALIRARQSDALFSANTWSLLTIFTNVIAATCANLQLVAKLRQHAKTLEGLVDIRTRQLQRSRDLLRIVFYNLPEGLVLLDA